MPSTVQILGIRFLDGDVDTAIKSISQGGGVLIAPSGTCFARLTKDPVYREAVVRADLAIPDSGAMVILWRIFRGKRVTRMSGLTYVRRLVEKFAHDPSNRTMWILPNERAHEKAAVWLNQSGVGFNAQDFYVAPFYGPNVEDKELARQIEQHRPDHVVIAIGSGPQEKLGIYLRDNLSYRPAIHCNGAALGFLTGDQVAIPQWADRFFLGWLFRLFAQPKIFIPRLTRAAILPWLILRYGRELPPLRAKRAGGK